MEILRTEDDAVDAAEDVLRRAYYTFSKPPDLLVSRSAFEPNPQDLDGLSVYRADFTSPEEVVAAAPGAADTYSVASILVAEILELGLTVVPDPQPTPEPRGHALIPEIRWNPDQDQAEKRRRRELQLELARLASQRVVLRSPRE